MVRRTLLASAAVALLLGSSAYAGSQWLITSTHQIKPSVLRQFQSRLRLAYEAGAVASMCPAGTDATGQCEVGGSDARCPGATTAIAGGFDGGTSPPVNATIGYSEPDRDGHGWNVVMANSGAGAATFRAVVACLAQGGFAQRARAAVPESVRAQIRREMAAIRSR